jgi:type II secretory pathway pseudopilin PulG
MVKERGFSYVIVMFLVAVLSLVATRAMQNTLTAERREKEAELLATGMAYRNAIRDYYENALGSAKTYPPSLKALLRDERWSRDQRPLRKLYRDPMTGSTEWGLIKLESDSNQIIGVYSLSPKQPVKRGGFAAELFGFDKAKTYRDWRFIYQPQ